jgi:hypothetical protein
MVIARNHSWLDCYTNMSACFCFPGWYNELSFMTLYIYNSLYGNIVGEISILTCLHVFILLALYT